MSRTNHRFSIKIILASLLACWLLAIPAAADQLRAPSKAPIKRTFGSIPEIPVMVVRYNIMGNVIAKLHVDKDGHTTETDIVDSPADFLSALVVDATQDWQFANVPIDGAVLTVTFPFKLEGNDYPYDKKVRPQKRIPKTVKDVAGALTNGWAEFKLLIDREGKPAKDPETKTWDHLILKSSGDDFKKSVPAIIAAMSFEHTTENLATPLSKAMNRFKVTVQDQAIQIEQFSAD